jgi:amidase
MTDDLVFTPALEQAAALRSGEIGALELVELYLRRIDRLDAQLHAYLTVAADQALDAARAAQVRLDEARDDAPPFLGVPISIKDLHDTAGIRTTHGTATWSARVPERDEEVVSRIRRAGFVILGKTNTPEFGSRSTTESPAYPTARNPWDPSRTPGGSSGGAAAALAAGLCAIAHGSDGGGSVRIPAAWCGLVGIKPSRGRISAAPGPQSWNATSGPLARTVADAASLLDVMSGPAPGDAWWAPPPARPFATEVGAPPGRLRIAWTATHPDPTATVEPAWRDAVDTAAAALAAEGHELIEAAPPVMDLASSALIPASALAARPDLPPLDSLDLPNRTLVEYANGASATELADAMRLLQSEARRVAGFFEPFDALLTPTLAAAPPAIEERIMGDEDFGGMLLLLRLVAFTPTWNMTGQPAIALPAGRDGDGLPVSVQLVGRAAGESALVRLAAQLERHLPPIGRPAVARTAES